MPVYMVYVCHSVSDRAQLEKYWLRAGRPGSSPASCLAPGHTAPSGRVRARSRSQRRGSALRWGSGVLRLRRSPEGLSLQMLLLSRSTAYRLLATEVDAAFPHAVEAL